MRDPGNEVEETTQFVVSWFDRLADNAQSRYPKVIQVIMGSEFHWVNCSWIETKLAHSKGERNYYFYNYFFVYCLILVLAFCILYEFSKRKNNN